LRQFLPFIITLVAILLTDLLTGILVGRFSSAFILYGNFNKGVRVYKESAHGIVTRIELPSQVTFLNRSALISALEHVHKDQQLIIDATQCDSIDPIFIKSFKIIKMRRQLNAKSTLSLLDLSSTMKR
jgi:MFS superfamily sulfate permease-like transporter